MRIRFFHRILSLTLVIFLTGLTGCASTPEYNGAVIETNLENLSRYWIADKKKVSFKPTAEEVAILQSTSGKTSGTFLIESNGNVTEIKIMQSEPPGVFDRATNKNYTGRSYSPGPDNPNRRPAKVSFESTFRMAPLEK